MAFGDNLNTFKLETEILGRIVRPRPGADDVIDAKFNPSSTLLTLQVADFVTLVPSAVEVQILVDGLTAITDIPYGMIVYNQRKNSYSKGETFSIVKEGAYVGVLAGESIEAGDELEFNYTTKKVMKLDTGKKVGIAQRNATTNSIFEMQIKF